MWRNNWAWNDAGNSVLLTEKHLSRGDWEDALDHKSWGKITNLTYRRITKDTLDHKSDKFPLKPGTSRWTHIFWAPRTWGGNWWESDSFDEIPTLTFYHWNKIINLNNPFNHSGLLLTNHYLYHPGLKYLSLRLHLFCFSTKMFNATLAGAF